MAFPLLPYSREVRVCLSRILHGETLPSSPALFQGCRSEPTWEDRSRMRLAGTGVIFTRGAGEHIPRGDPGPS